MAAHSVPKGAALGKGTKLQRKAKIDVSSFFSLVSCVSLSAGLQMAVRTSDSKTPSDVDGRVGELKAALPRRPQQQH